MRSRHLYLALALALAACTSNESADDAPPPPPGDVTPVAGTWGYQEITKVSSNCPNDLSRFEGGNFLVDQVGGASFRIVPGDGTNPFSCSLGDASFDCPQRLADTIDERPGADAVFTIQATADGRFSDSRHGSGRQDATVDCSGTACSLAGVPFPCTFSVDFVIVAQ